MDVVEARFILRCFRPDGADAECIEFAQSLALAAKDRELGGWLAHERSKDSEFANALKSLAVPCGLREELIVAMDCTAKFRKTRGLLPSSWLECKWLSPVRLALHS